MVNSKQKGSRVERLIVNWLKEKGFEARRTQQYNGKDGLSDVICANLPRWHIESKGTAQPVPFKSMLEDWYSQIMRDCPIEMYPVVLHKPNGLRIRAYLPARSWNFLTGSNLNLSITDGMFISLDGDDFISLTKAFFTCCVPGTTPPQLVVSP